MYGVRSDFPFDRLVGATLEQICIGENDLQFRFDGSTVISVTSGLALNGGVKESDFGLLATALCKLLGMKITAAAARNDKSLVITIGSNELEIFDDSVEFESFVV